MGMRFRKSERHGDVAFVLANAGCDPIRCRQSYISSYVFSSSPSPVGCFYALRLFCYLAFFVVAPAAVLGAGHSAATRS